MKRALLLAAALGTITFPAHAEIDIGSYKKYLSLGKDGADDAIDMYVIGLGRGAMMANAAVVAKGGEPVFCIPPNLALQGDQIKNILNWTGQPFVDIRLP